MILKNSIDNMIHKLHLNNFFKPHKKLWNDNRGGFLIPVELKVKDKEYERYRHLPINWSVPPITKDDLPSEFSQKAVNTVNLFRRKTFDLDVECMIFFDIHSGNIVSCNFADENKVDNVEGTIYVDFLEGMHIASVHNHPNAFCSPPSGKNFEMLGLEFEEYELILSQNELWILESYELFDKKVIETIRKKDNEYLNSIFEEVNFELDENYMVLDAVNKIYGDLLLIYLNSSFDNIKITRRYLND